MNILESLNRGLETKYHLNEAKEDKERFLFFINATIKDNVKSQAIVDNFDKLKSSGRIKGEKADYYYWIKNKTVNELQDFLNSFNTSLSKTQTKKQEKEGAERMPCSNKDWLIYKITTYDASTYYGEHTQWCITGRNGPDGEKAFNQYKREGVKDYYFLWKLGNEKNGKWCYLDYGEEIYINTYCFYDAQDNQHTIKEVDIPDDVLLSLPGISQELFNYIQKINDGMAEIKKTGVYTYNPLDDAYFIQDLHPEKIVVPDRVKKIEGWAFYSCGSLHQIILPDSIEEIGSHAFAYCDSLQEINIPNSVKNIDECAFDSCDSLKEINLPNSVKEIGSNAFDSCDSLKEINIPNSVEKIGIGAFECCMFLKNITLSNRVKKIGDNVFRNCRSLQKINLPNSVKEIGSNAFDGCDSLQEINIPNSVEKIGGNAFNYCTALQKINLPNSVKEIGNFAFNKCDSLQEVILPNSIENFGYGVFEKCASLKEVQISNGVKEIGGSTFSDCKSLQEIVIPDSVKEIGMCAFSGCGSLKEISLPDSVEKLGDYVFNFCPSLQEIKIKGEYRPKMLKNAGLNYTVIINWVDCGVKETWGDIKYSL